MFYQITKNEKHIIRNKNDINGEKKPGTRYCFGCKDFTHDFRPQEVKMTNKVLREISNCVVCQSKKLRFLNQKHNNNKK